MVTKTAPDPAVEWWTTSDVAAYLGVQVATVTNEVVGSSSLIRDVACRRCALAAIYRK